MAKDDNTNDKEQDDFFGDDEDFGLPELTYEALDDDDSEETLAEEPAVDDDSLFESESIEEDDIPDQISDEELKASFAEDDSMEDANNEDDIADGAMGEDFYEEESFDDFGVEEDGIEGDGKKIPDTMFDSDGLDEDEFGQFEKELMDTEEEDVADRQTFDPYKAPARGKNKFARVVIIGIVMFAALGGIFWFMFLMDGSGEERESVAEKTTPKPVVETTKEEPEAKPEVEEEVANTENNSNTTSNQPELTSPAKTPASTKPKTVTATPSTVNALNERTGNSYIIIGSFLDADKAMRYATKFSNAGKSPSVISPFGKAVTHRVAIASYSTFAKAQKAIDGFKAEYGQDIWILRY